MFISKKRSKQNPNVYVQLVESYRQDGKMNQRVIKHIGTAPSEEHLEKIIKLANEIKEMFLQNISTKKIEIYHKQEINKINGTGNLIQNCVPIKRIAKGLQEIYGKIFDAMGLKQIITSKTNYAEIIKNIVIGRIACLGSKRKTCEQLEKKFNKKYSLSALYRAMDKLTPETIELIQAKICNYNKSLLNNEIKVLFYDATTIYFESFNDDELRRLGYSKDLKFSQPQIILTMLITASGLPLGYQVFPGNTYEGNTLLMAMSYWKKLYPQQKITLVADSGMLNEINLSTLEQDGFDYIVCARLKSFSKSLKKQIIDTKHQGEGAGDYYYNLDIGSRRLIISYRENRAIKDRYDRNKAINNLKTKLKTSHSPATLISNYGYKKYITIDSGSEITLNEDKIIEAEKWDGLHGLITNIKDLNAEDVYGYYRGLWQIEDAFRLNKTDLEIRPIFHWTPDRIKAHMAISYIAYCCYKIVEFKVNQELNEKISHRAIKELLDEIETIIYEDQNTREQFMMPTPSSEKAQTIYKIFNQELICKPCRYTA